VIVRFDDIGAIDDHHCLNILKVKKIPVFPLTILKKIGYLAKLLGGGGGLFWVWRKKGNDYPVWTI
jgi:hypothetical protein